MEKKVWTKDEIVTLLEKSDRALIRAIQAIYRLQTPDEQSTGTNKCENGVGFTRFDASFLTDLARQVGTTRSLSPKQMAIARNKMKKYWKQLLSIANEKNISH